MSDLIHDRGRGPELIGTRITVYRIMDFDRDGSSPEEMASELRLTAEQVAAALPILPSIAKPSRRSTRRFSSEFTGGIPIGWKLIDPSRLRS